MKFFGRRLSEIVDGIEFRGRAAFRARTREALELLRLSPLFGAARNHIAVIRQGRCSGVKAWLEKPTFTVGKSTWRHSAVWYAGAIAHDAYHAKLYCDAKSGNHGKEPDNDAWTGVEAEKRCLAFQRQVLVELNADGTIIAYIDHCAQNPTYQGHTTGWRSWLDYLLRWW
ncbi:MAG: hypothetical protein HYS66_05365 [Deltaproteobacteria bacterium]|nr:hypothetical protein [Deltaproteobacteria bacterium]